LNDDLLKKLASLQEASEDYLAQLRARLADRLEASVEARIREFELKVHEGIAEARRTYEQGLDRLERLPEPLQPIECSRLEKALARSIDFHFDLLGALKISMEAN
jgi:hypothetical protein